MSYVFGICVSTLVTYNLLSVIYVKKINASFNMLLGSRLITYTLYEYYKGDESYYYINYSAF